MNTPSALRGAAIPAAAEAAAPMSAAGCTTASGLVLRPYQAEIIEAACRHLDAGGRGQLHMAPASGKTITIQQIAIRLLRGGGLIALLVPSVWLAGQTLQTWLEELGTDLDVLVACDDPTTLEMAADYMTLPVAVTTDPDEIYTWVCEQRPGVRLALSTYKSAPLLGAAVRRGGCKWDVMVVDEAHHLTGLLDTPTRQLHSDTRFPAHRRLYATGTPKEYDKIHYHRTSTGTKGEPFVGMDDTALFGKVVGTYTAAQGAADGYLREVDVAVMGVTTAEARAARAAMAQVKRGVVYVGADTDLPLSIAASHVALAKAADEFGVRNVLSYHPRVQAAEDFAATLPSTLQAIAPQHARGLYARHVHGRMPLRDRNRILDALRRDHQGLALVASARCLTEGINLPTLDAAVITYAKESETDIAQIVGRLMRTGRGANRKPLLIIGVLVDDTGPDAQIDAGDFDKIINVVRALCATDERFAAALDLKRNYRPEHHLTRLPERIIVRLPPGVADSILDALTLRIIRETTAAWFEGYNAARRYQEKNGHLFVPTGYTDEDGFNLYLWVKRQRQSMSRGSNNSHCRALLDLIGMIWNPREARHASKLASVAQFCAEFGHTSIPQNYVGENGLKPGAYLNECRKAHHNATLSPAVERALATLGVDLDPRETAWRARLAEFEEHKARTGSISPSGPLGQWRADQFRMAREGRLLPHRRHLLAALGIPVPEARDTNAPAAIERVKAPPAAAVASSAPAAIFSATPSSTAYRGTRPKLAPVLFRAPPAADPCDWRTDRETTEQAL